MSDLAILKSEYATDMKTLQELSFDSAHMEHMTQQNRKAYDFDMIKTKYMQNLKKTEEGIHSSDALMIAQEKVVFIEFKNGKTYSANELLTKMRDSLLLFCDIVDDRISNTRNYLEYIVVYNALKRPLRENEKDVVEIECCTDEIEEKTYLKKHLFSKARKEFVRWGFNNYKGVFFKDVHTYDKEEFENYIRELPVESSTQ